MSDVWQEPCSTCSGTGHVTRKRAQGIIVIDGNHHYVVNDSDGQRCMLDCPAPEPHMYWRRPTLGDVTVKYEVQME